MLYSDGLYHQSLGFPIGAISPWLGNLKLSHTNHSIAQCYRPECRRHVQGGVITIPEGETLVVDAASVIEVEISGGVPVKALIRLQYDDRSDVCFALIAPVNGVSKCKTLWTLNARDHHRSMDMSKYTKPQKIVLDV